MSLRFQGCLKQDVAGPLSPAALSFTARALTNTSKDTVWSKLPSGVPTHAGQLKPEHENRQERA